MQFEYAYGATPTDLDEAALLIPKHIRRMSELNAFEHANILMAEQWALRSQFSLSVAYLKKLHKNMFNQTWKWAGQFRTTGKNIGVDAYRIETELQHLCNDISFQIEHHSFLFDELCARFHHRLVLIHAFPNGNGRHARLMTDLLLMKSGHKRFTWGSLTKDSEANIRRTYISSLRLADEHELKPLLDFVRS